ncbi:MAG: lysoplasmalogenase [Flavobacteriales bacterium]|jgi:uncharacterized membrane protein YhhN|nr:lysoplasmalogenase [Flavobacteriales bacterium]
MFKQVFLLLFFLTSILQVAGEIFHNDFLIFVFKPLLMPLLLLWYFYNTSKNNRKSAIVTALIFSFLGDTFLLFVYQNELFFLLGLGSFLVAQLAYVVTFNKDRIKHRLPSGFIALILLFFVFYIGILFYSISENLNDFLIPVIVYASAVGLMGITAAFRYLSVNNSSFIQVFIGAFLFVVSDTFIALDKFLYYGELAYASVIIMSLYIIGQFFIVRGTLALED